MNYQNPTIYLQKGSTNSGSILAGILEGMPMVRIYEKGRMIYCQGDHPDHFYYLKKGTVRVFMVSESGSEKTLSLISKGAILGEAAFFDGQARMSSACAVERCEIVTVNRNVMTEMIRRQPDAAMELLRLQAGTIRQLSRQVDSAAFLSAGQRLCMFLLESITQSGKASVRVTHEEIGSIIGCTRVTVSKLLRQLTKKEILETSYGVIIVKNEEKLRSLCDE